MENKNYCVYKHTSPNGKMYIGMTGQNPEKRWGKGKEEMGKRQTLLLQSDI